MIPDTLIKFIPLANDNDSKGDSDFKRAKHIIETGEFWCSKLWGLNDPMEGVYRTSNSSEKVMKTVYGEKNKYGICSFSHPNALKCPLLWGHYANGFKGIAIEIKCGTDKTYIEKIDYVDDVKEVDNIQNPDITKIITTKLNFWKYEQEYRYLNDEKIENHKIGEVKKVYFGTPYGNIANNEQVFGNETLEDYDRCRKKLKDCINNKNENENEKICIYDFKFDVKTGQMIRWLNLMVKTENDVAVANTRAEVSANRPAASGI